MGTVKNRNWNHCKIVVSTIQTLLAGNRYRQFFSPIDFEFVISDEAHRSINGNSRAVFEYFIGFKLGLTATPKSYLKGIDKKDLAQKNIRALEERNLRDTYKTFGCEENPTYRYDLNEGVKGCFLLSPYAIDVRTKITTQILSDDGYAVMVENEEGDKQEAIFKKDFERTFFNEPTNGAFCQSILENGLQDPFTGEFGKTIVFCVSQKHAAKITQILNQMASQKWQNKYNSDFAVQVTSHVQHSGQYTKDFSANKLRGKSKFNHEQFPDYDTSKARVCVTVGMMTTGYDCPDLLNVVLMRPIFSPTDFIQMKGRGTRKYQFKYHEIGKTKDKEKFLLLDFFANCEYFEKDFDYDKQIPLPIKTGNFYEPQVPETKINPEVIDLNEKDHVTTETVIYIGKEGMKIDQELYPQPHQQFEEVLKHNTLQKINEEQGTEALERFIKTEVFNQPTEYWTAEKIRQSYEQKYQTRRKIPLTEMILKALGLQKSFKNRKQRLEEEFQKFIDIEKPLFSSQHQQDKRLNDFFENYLSDKVFREIIDSEQYAELTTYSSFNMRELTEIKELFPIAKNYVKAYLPKEMAEFEWREND